MALKMKFKMCWKLRILSVVFLGLVCFLTGTECKRSACWRYGHVCWGGHGKRSEQPPLSRISGKAEPEDGRRSYFSSQWNLLSAPNPSLKMHPDLFQQLPNGMNIRDSRQHTISLTNKEKKFLPILAKLRPQKPFPIQAQPLKPFALRQNERRMYHGSINDRDAMSDALIIPESALPLSLPAKSVRMYSTSAFKRTQDEIQGNSVTGGTEEPLETSANGLDTENDGSVATFFRDRKLSSLDSNIPVEDIGKERYSNTQAGKEPMDSVWREQSDLFPITDYKLDKNILLAKAGLYY